MGRPKLLCFKIGYNNKILQADYVVPPSSCTPFIVIWEASARAAFEGYLPILEI